MLSHPEIQRRLAHLRREEIRATVARTRRGVTARPAIAGGRSEGERRLPALVRRALGRDCAPDVA